MGVAAMPPVRSSIPVTIASSSMAYFIIQRKNAEIALPPADGELFHSLIGELLPLLL